MSVARNAEWMHRFAYEQCPVQPGSFEYGMRELAERLTHGASATAAVSAELRTALNLCGDDRGCQCESAKTVGDQLAKRLIAAALDGATGGYDGDR